MTQFLIGSKVEYKYYDSDIIHKGFIYEFKNLKLIKSDTEYHSPAVYMRNMEFCRICS